MSVNDFIIGKNLGKGTFGSVYIVIRKDNGHKYAMKRVHIDNMNKREKECALNEVKILSSLKHPNIIGYKKAFFENNHRILNIVMELADNGDIESKIQNCLNLIYFNSNGRRIKIFT